VFNFHCLDLLNYKSIAGLVIDISCHLLAISPIVPDSADGIINE
jgi:hypothetical protein